MKKIERLNTKMEIVELRSKGLPDFINIDEVVQVVTAIIDSKMNEVINAVNELTEWKGLYEIQAKEKQSGEFEKWLREEKL